MKGHDEIIEALNDVLMAELTAINIYFIHYKMEENWGFEKLAQHAKKESFGEMKHAEEIIERILFLEGVPNMSRYDAVLVGETCEEHLNNQYKIETQHVERLRKAIQLSMEKQDFGTKEMLDHILQETEESADWLETQFQRIKDVGIQNYLSEHMHVEE